MKLCSRVAEETVEENVLQPEAPPMQQFPLTIFATAN